MLLAALLTLLPLENAEGADAEADERLLRELAATRELDAKIGGCWTSVCLSVCLSVCIACAAVFSCSGTAQGRAGRAVPCMHTSPLMPAPQVVIAPCPACHAAWPAGEGGAAEDQHWAVLKLAWGVLLSQYGPDTAAGKHESLWCHEHLWPCCIVLHGCAPFAGVPFLIAPASGSALPHSSICPASPGAPLLRRARGQAGAGSH